MESNEEPNVLEISCSDLQNVIEAGFVSARSLVLNEKKESILSPGFRSVAASDNEALLLASVAEGSSSLADLIVEDSPLSERRKREVRTSGLAKTPASGERRRARKDNLKVERKGTQPAATKQPVQGNSMGVKTCLATTGKNEQSSSQNDVQFEDQNIEPTSDRSKQESLEPSESILSKSEKGSVEPSENFLLKNEKGFSKTSETTPSKSEKGSSEPSKTTPSKSEKQSSEPSKTTPSKREKQSSRPACQERLREELSCAVCLDIYFEPSTTSCGHSFCKMCLKNVIEICGSHCPKCRKQLKGAFQACQINTVLWNTVRLLFPKEVEGRINAKKKRDETLKLEKKKEKPKSHSNQANRAVENISNSHGHPTRGIGLSRPAYTTTTASNFRRAFQPATSSQGRQHLAPELVTVETNERGGSRRNRDQEELDAQLASRLQEEELMRNFRAGGRRNRVQREHHHAANVHEREQTNQYDGMRSWYDGMHSWPMYFSW